MKVCFVQPVLTNYRLPVFSELASCVKGRFSVLADMPSKDFGVEDAGEIKSYYCEASWKSVFNLRFPLRKEFWGELFSSSHIIHFADFKYVSLWIALSLSALRLKKVFLHGQGGYKKTGLIASLLYRVVVLMSDGYICYTGYSATQLKSRMPKCLRSKVFVVENSLVMKKRKPPVEVDHELFYVGRIREGSGIELLLSAASDVGVGVSIVGAGESAYLKELTEKYPCARFFGGVFDEDLQYEIAAKCLAGVYAGDAGLSVVHYMAFGLPVIVHSDITHHMGPEPSYIKDGVNGILFERGCKRSLVEAIDALKVDPELRVRLSAGAVDTFQSLSNPTMARKFFKILKGA